jgi:threonine dehydrogenase-like Zn-dependent dehydrogenase
LFGTVIVVLARLPSSESDATLARERLQVVADRSRPITLARDQTLPLVEPLATMFPEGRLRRGITVAVRGPGSTTLAFALAASASSAGSWVAMVGVADVNLATAAEVGVALERVAVMQPPPAQWAATIAAVIGAFDIVVLAPAHRVSASDARRLMARARERGSVLITLMRTARAWPERVDLELSISTLQWQGLGQGHGNLRARVARVDMTGRRELARPRQGEFVLPDASGHLACALSE